MTTFLAFIGDMTGWDWVIVIAASWCIVAALVAPCMGRVMRDEDEIRQPAVRDWLCSDGYYRTEAEAVIWVEVTPGSNAWHQPAEDAGWLPEWINDHDDAPLYVPQEWVA